MNRLDAIPYPHIDPVFLELGPLQFRWYGLMYLLGLTIAYFVIRQKVQAQGLGLTKDQVYDMVVWAAFGVFIGGRFGYVLFYNLPYYLEYPSKILAVWEGGMSFHGGLIGTIVALIWFGKRHGISIYTIADMAASVTPIGLGLGRLGNFINGELFGRPTDVEWCMVFPAGGPACRHPSQLYELALEGVLLFSVLWVIGRRPTPPGTTFGVLSRAMDSAGCWRNCFENRTPTSASFSALSMGQVLSLPMVIIGSFMLALGYQRQALARREQPAGKIATG